MPSLANFLRPHPPAFPIISDDEAVQTHYRRCRRTSSHAFAEMLALRSAPALQTDTRWLARKLEAQRREINPESLTGSTLLESARESGISVEGRVYEPGLAEYPNDPRAFVESRAECYARAEELGLDLEGALEYKCTRRIEPKEEGPYRIDDDLLEEHYEDAIENEPHLAKKADFKEELQARLSGEET